MDLKERVIRYILELEKRVEDAEDESSKSCVWDETDLDEAKNAELDDAYCAGDHDATLGIVEELYKIVNEG